MVTPALWARGATIAFTAPQRPVHSVWLHCSASDRTADDDVSVMRQWHLARGWNDVGYHYFIQKSGDIQAGRPVGTIPSAQAGFNTGAIAICCHGLKIENFTIAQYQSVIALCTAIRAAYPVALRFRGHCEVSPKTCPVYNYKQVLGLDAAGHMTGPTSAAAPPSAPPPPAGSGSATSRTTLSLTSHGPAVKVLQNLLVVNGIACSADGVFGQATSANVRRFQTRAGLSVTGRADVRTQQSLARGLPGIRDLAVGHNGADVQAFQRIIKLHQIDVHDDGSFGPLTKAAVERFQRKFAVPTTGVVDLATRLKSFG